MKKVKKNIFTLLGFIVLPALLNAQNLAHPPFKNNLLHSHAGIKQSGGQKSNAGTTAIITINRLHGKSQDYGWDSVTNAWAWQWNQEEIIKYAGKGRLLSDVVIYDTTNPMDTASKQLNNYFDFHGSVSQGFYGDNNGVLQLQYIDTALNDINGNQVRYVYYNLDTTNKWVLSFGYTDQLTYDGNGNVIADLNRQYIDSSGTWVNYSDDNYSVNTNGSWKTDTAKYWVGNQWVNTVLYDSINWKNWNGIANSQTNYYILKTWNGGAWQDSAKISDAYNSNGGSVETSQIMSSGTWTNYSRELQLMDSLGNSTGYINDTFNGSGWTEISGENIIYTYDSSGNITQEIDQNYDIPSGQNINSAKFVYSNFSSFTAIKEASRPQMAMSIFPNPATNMIHLQGSPASSEQMDISVYDLQGQVLISRQINSNELSAGITIPVNNLANGIYILHSATGSQETNLKFIKD